MTSNHNPGGNYWGYLFKSDKSATPLLEQLCLGLAQIIVRLGFPTRVLVTDLCDDNRANLSQVRTPD
jgi:hypothetical protein